MSTNKKKPKGFSTRTLDKLWSRKIIERAGNKCEVCGCSKELNAHHISGRKNYNTRWYLGNGCCLCNNCHQKGIYSAHKNPVWFISKILLMRGSEWAIELIAESTRTDWRERLEDIKRGLL